MTRMEIAALAHRQRGYVTRRQLLALGESRNAIYHAIRAGRLIPAHAGVYALGHLPTLPQDRAFGALLACGSGAVLSHGTAAAVWGIYRRWTMPCEVTAPGCRRRPGIVIHRATLPPAEKTTQLGLPVTTPARTVLDISPRLSERALTRVVNDLRHTYLRLEHLAESLDRCPRHPGVARLRPFVDAPKGPTRSEFEDAFQAFRERFGLPEALINTKVAGFEVDVYFPAERVVVQLDGWEFHSSRESFISDRDEDATLLAQDIVTVRITWERIEEKSVREARRLIKILEQRAGRANSYPPLMDL
jgi:hypothetical protein